MISISVCGVDGSGKSTLIGKIKTHLESRGQAVRVYQIRQEAPSIRIENTLFRLFPFLKKSSRKTLADDTGARPAKKGLRFRLLRVYAFLMFRLDRCAFRAILKRAKSKGTLLLCDRSLEDIVAHLLFRQLIDEKKARNLLRNAPVSDILVWMRVSDEEGCSRRPEHPRGYFCAKEKAYKTVMKERSCIETRAGEDSTIFSQLNQKLFGPEDKRR